MSAPPSIAALLALHDAALHADVEARRRDRLRDYRWAGHRMGDLARATAALTDNEVFELFTHIAREGTRP